MHSYLFLPFVAWNWKSISGKMLKVWVLSGHYIKVMLYNPYHIPLPFPASVFLDPFLDYWQAFDVIRPVSPTHLTWWTSLPQDQPSTKTNQEEGARWKQYLVGCHFPDGKLISVKRRPWTLLWSEVHMHSWLFITKPRAYLCALIGFNLYHSVVPWRNWGSVTVGWWKKWEWEQSEVS